MNQVRLERDIVIPAGTVLYELFGKYEANVVLDRYMKEGHFSLPKETVESLPGLFTRLV